MPLAARVCTRSRVLAPAALPKRPGRLILVTIRTASAQSILPRGRAGASELSFAQERLWFLDQLEPGLPVYNICTSYRIHGKLDISALEQALAAVTARHEILRTVYRSAGGTPLQEVCEPAPVALARRKLDRTEAAEAEALRLAGEEARRPFQLDSGPMLRALLIELAAADYLLVLTVHHIASDAWSRGVFHRDLSEFYAASIDNREPDLTPLAIQYADFARWQREWLQGENLERHLDYWRHALSGAPPLLDLPTSRPRPAVSPHRGDEVRFHLSAGLTARMRELATGASTTPFVVCLASLYALLHRYTGAGDLTAGTAVAGRTQLECDDSIGCFVNMLALRADLSGNPRFSELLSRIRRHVLEGLAHQQLPFEKLVKELNPEREMSRNPLFQVAISYKNVPRQDLVLPGAEVAETEISTGTSKFDWSFDVTVRPGGASCALVFDASIYGREAMERVAVHWTNLLTGLAANPDLRLSELPLLCPEERRRVVHVNNQTRRPYPQQPVHELVTRRAAETPEAVAVEAGARSVTYRELDADSDTLAARLTELGAGPGRVVAVYSGRIPEMVTGLLAILKTGAAYMPLDPSAPPPRTAYLMETSGAVALLAEERLEDELPPLAPPVICLERFPREGERPGARAPRPKVPMDALACVLHTSGSTGTPKGARILHRGIVRLLFSGEEVALGRDTVFLHMAPLAFDASTLEIWGGLVHGGRTALHAEAIPTPETIEASIRRHGVNTMWITASLFNLLVEENVECLKPLRLLMTGGETLSPPHVRKALRALPDTRLVNGYGPTENTTFTTCYGIPKELADDVASIPIGRPIGNTTVYVLDPYGNPVPEGVIGEIFTGGDGLADGYWNAPDLTAESFPILSIPGQEPARLYRTGDFGRWNRSGLLEFAGRKDDQVKIRGFRIELREVEAALESHPGVERAVAAVWEPEPGRKSLAGWVVPVAGANPSEAELRAHLQKTVPAYLTPAAIGTLAEIPLTGSGKVDRRSLPAPQPGAREESPAKPADQLEEKLLEIWTAELGRDRIGVTESFFELGGDSLRAVKIIARVREAFGRALPLATLFEAPTIRGMAAIIRRQGWKPRWSSLVPIQTSGERTPFFCVHAAGGNVLFYQNLARHLGSGQPVYALQSAGVAGDQPHTTVEDMASAYIEELKQVQPEGPYLLGGFCSGAYIALEMAHQLQARGDPVKLLVSFNTDGAWKTVTSLRAALGFHRNNLGRIENSERLEYVATRLRYRGRRIRKTIIQAICRAYLRLGGRLSGPLLLNYVEELNRRAIYAYEPRRFDGDLVYFQGGGEHFLDPKPFWGGLVNEIEVERVPGRAITIFEEPHVQTLAERLSFHLRRAMN